MSCLAYAICRRQAPQPDQEHTFLVGRVALLTIGLVVAFLLSGAAYALIGGWGLAAVAVLYGPMYVWAVIRDRWL